MSRIIKNVKLILIFLILMIASLIFSPSNGSLSSHVNAGYIPSDGEIVAPGMKASCGCYANLEQGVLLYGLDISQYTGKDIELSNGTKVSLDMGGPCHLKFGYLNHDTGEYDEGIVVGMASFGIYELEKEYISSGTYVPKIGSEINVNELGNKEIWVSLYCPHGKLYLCNEGVRIVDWINNIDIVNIPKTKYIQGEELDLTGMKIIPSMATGTQLDAIDISQCRISGYDKNKIGKQDVNVTYQYEFYESDVITGGATYNSWIYISVTKTFEVEVEGVSSIALNTTPKTQYNYGEKLDVENGLLDVVTTSGEQKVIKIAEDMVSGYNKNIEGDQTLTITYGGQTVTYDVNVKDFEKEIKIVPPSKFEYIAGESLNLDGAKVQLIMASGAIKEEVALTDNMLQNQIDDTIVGAQRINVSYKGFTNYFTVSVSANSLTGIQVDTTNGKLVYYQNEANLDVSNISLKLIYANGSILSMNVTNDMVSGFDTSAIVDSKPLTVKFGNFTDVFNIQVKADEISEISMNRLPNKLEYADWSLLDVTGGKVNVVYKSGKIDIIDLTNDMMPDRNVYIPYGETNPIREMKVKYNGFSTTFNVKCVPNYTVQISLISLPTKIVYNYGEDLDCTGLNVLEIRANGESIRHSPDFTWDLQTNRISGYDKYKVGKQTVTYTTQYGGEVQFDVTVLPQANVPSNGTSSNTSSSNNNTTSSSQVVSTSSSNVKVEKLVSTSNEAQVLSSTEKIEDTKENIDIIDDNVNESVNKDENEISNNISNIAKNEVNIADKKEESSTAMKAVAVVMLVGATGALGATFALYKKHQ